jgi:hypothetical protein
VLHLRPVRTSSGGFGLPRRQRGSIYKTRRPSGRWYCAIVKESDLISQGPWLHGSSSGHAAGTVGQLDLLHRRQGAGHVEHVHLYDIVVPICDTQPKQGHRQSGSSMKWLGEYFVLFGLLALGLVVMGSVVLVVLRLL